MGAGLNPPPPLGEGRGEGTRVDLALAAERTPFPLPQPLPQGGRGVTAIVGGGIAGIACAVELTQAGREVVLFESAKQLGGRARGVEWQGLAVDNGQHLMIGAYVQTRRLLDALGTTYLLEQRLLRLIVPGFELRLPRLPAPLHLAFGLLFARGLSLAEKWAALRFMRGLQACGFRLPADTTVAELLRGQPQRLIDRLWAPICVAALNTPVAIASAQVFCNVLRDSLAGRREASDFLFNRADFGRLLGDAAHASLGARVHLASKVTALSRTTCGFHLAGPDIEVEQVVLAVHPARLPALLAAMPELAGVSRAVAGYAWQPILTLWLRFADPVVLPYPMLGLAACRTLGSDSENRPRRGQFSTISPGNIRNIAQEMGEKWAGAVAHVTPMQPEIPKSDRLLGLGEAPWAFDRSDLAPGMIAIVMSADGPHLHRPPEALRDDYLDLLAAAVGPLPVLQDWKFITEKRATWSCTPDLPRPDNATPVVGLYLAGDYTAGDYPATLEAAVASGVKSARLLLKESI